MRISVETFHNRIEGLLSGSIPKLEFDIYIFVDLDYFCVILHSQSDRVMIQKLIC